MKTARGGCILSWWSCSGRQDKRVCVARGNALRVQGGSVVWLAETVGLVANG
ncbi:MAG: hypothetical protein LBF81_07415 [Prevotellaceae bacterium]|jgi:hypothetical protein|nr:hypothetical protein [Prevotellaceae bacterium]